MYSSLKWPSASQITFRWTSLLLGSTTKAFITNAALLGYPIESLDEEYYNKDYATLLRDCISLKRLEEGKRVHTHIIITGFQPWSFTWNRLIDMYAKCGNVADARRMFDRMPEQDGGSWNAMISGYARHGHGEEALKLFWQMQSLGLKPNEFTIASVLGACSSQLALEQAKQVHAHIINTGYVSNVFLGSALVDIYAKCGNLEDARNVFDEMPERNDVSWNVMIARYARLGHFQEALKLFSQMQQEGMKAAKFTFANVLTVCACLSALLHGKQLHAHIVRTGFESNVIVGSALVDMYAKCGNIEDARHIFNALPERDVVSWTAMVGGYIKCGRVDDARHVFDEMPERNIVSWNAMITGYVQNSRGEEALDLFGQMQRTHKQLDQVTLGSTLNACATVMDLELGKQVHAYAVRIGFDLNVFVGNAILDMYCKCGSIENAREWFLQMVERDRVSWNAMISGYARHGQDEQALHMFRQMQLAGMVPTQFTFSSVLSACANLAILEYGKQVHACTVRFRLDSNVFVESALVDMYAKCGSLRYARQVFDKMVERDVVAWNAIIAGYANNSSSKEALELFENMVQAGSKPDHITFIAILNACTNGGLVNAGRFYFDSMSRDYYITPRVEHYACMIDLLGHMGCMDEVDDFINNMPFEPNSIMWKSLLDACRIHGNIELGKRAVESLLELEPENTAPYVILSKIYTAAGRLDDAADLRKTVN
eukprot:Gb_05127 [translate_table: standard]